MIFRSRARYYLHTHQTQGSELNYIHLPLDSLGGVLSVLSILSYFDLFLYWATQRCQTPHADFPETLQFTPSSSQASIFRCCSSPWRWRVNELRSRRHPGNRKHRLTDKSQDDKREDFTWAILVLRDLSVMQATTPSPRCLNLFLLSRNSTGSVHVTNEKQHSTVPRFHT